MTPKLTPAVEQVELLGMTVEALTDVNAEKLGVNPDSGVLINRSLPSAPSINAFIFSPT